MSASAKRCIRFTLALLGLWLGLKLLLPLLFPFFLGALLALGADKAACFLCQKGRLPRSLAAGIAVSGEIAGLGLLLLIFAGLLVSQIGNLTQALPSILNTAQSGIALLEGKLLQLGPSLPDGLEGSYRQGVQELFSSGAELLSRLSRLVLGTAGAALSRLPGQALTLGTAILSGFLICAKLPTLREALPRLLNSSQASSLLRGLGQLRTAGKLWLTSQIKLMGVTFCILFSGFCLLRTPYPLLLAFLVALVDALPVLGTGCILLPWALVCVLNGTGARGLGLLGLYLTAALTRSVLEPKLVGSHLGLDPLVTLIAMYCGLRLWGLMGMLLLPMVTAAVFRALPETNL